MDYRAGSNGTVFKGQRRQRRSGLSEGAVVAEVVVMLFAWRKKIAGIYAQSVGDIQTYRAELMAHGPSSRRFEVVLREQQLCSSGKRVTCHFEQFSHD